MLVVVLGAHRYWRRLPEPRYEPLPGFAELPGWIWRRLSRRSRFALGVTLLAVVGLSVALVPALRQEQRERAAAERQAAGEQHAQRIRAIQAEQRPRHLRSDSVAPAGASRRERLAARAGLMDELRGAIVGDARRRVREGTLAGPIRRATCEPFPATVDAVGADKDLARHHGRFACLAITTEIQGTAGNAAGAVGHPYRAQVDFRTGRYALCKISGRPDPIPDPEVTTPRDCGGE